MGTKNLYTDAVGRLITDGPAWEVDSDKLTPKLADNVWSTALGCFAYPNKRKDLLESLKTCKIDLPNNKFYYWRHPDWNTDNFSRDQYIMLIAANFFFGDINDFPPKFKLSKRYRNTPNIIAWWKYLKDGNKFAGWVFRKTMFLTIQTFYLRWWIYDNVTKKLPMPEFYAFHLMCWQYYCYTSKETKLKDDLLKHMMKYLDYCEDRVGGDCNVLLWNLLGEFKSDIKDIPRSSGFPWQNLVPWSKIKFQSHHEYSKGYWNEVPENEKCLYIDILNYFK